ncbi:unnamed protein product [Cuscuta epithymum]|uniref:Uncharacterized protein n=1 Tax=Cuscuta epithymum TaxID=186058 RepID=A0AAV0ECF9_9ASTE|nr:unnamed protein product [Cuscuta epithymum]
MVCLTINSTFQFPPYPTNISSNYFNLFAINPFMKYDEISWPRYKSFSSAGGLEPISSSSAMTSVLIVVVQNFLAIDRREKKTSDLSPIDVLATVLSHPVQIAALVQILVQIDIIADGLK